MLWKYVSGVLLFKHWKLLFKNWYQKAPEFSSNTIVIINLFFNAMSSTPSPLLPLPSQNPSHEVYLVVIIIFCIIMGAKMATCHCLGKYVWICHCLQNIRHRDKTYFRPYIFTRFSLWSLTFFFTAFSPCLEKRLLF